ncbi:N/A [soil metagenome]
MHSERERLRRDLARSHKSAKGRLVCRLYRLGRMLPGPLRGLYQPFYFFMTDMLVGVTLPLVSEVGGGLLIRHGQGIVISKRSRIGEDCEIYQGVTLGEKHGVAPQIGDRVFIGANAVLLGGIRVGSGARIGAGAIVLDDVPANGIAIGMAAQIRGA